MPLIVAEHLIGQTTKPEAVILDPMAGSGTTLIAAKKLGRQALGFDRDPLALLVARSTIWNFETSRLIALKDRVLERARIYAKQNKLPQMREQLPEEDQAFIRYWFPSQSQKQLFALAHAIEHEHEIPERDLAWVVFSNLIIAKSAGASYALDIPRSRPHKRLDKSVIAPFDGWCRQFSSAIRHLPFIDNNVLAMESRIEFGDARALPVEDQTVDLVLTSPPYFNAVDYLRAHKFSLVWMGHRLENLRNLRGTMVGTERGLWSLDGLPSELEEHLDQKLEEGRRRAQVRRYLSDLHKVLGEIKRVLRPGGLVLLVMGTTIIATRRTDAVKIVSKIGETVGLHVVGSVVRRLNQARRSLPLPKPAGKQSTLANRMRREMIVALRK